MAEGTDGRKDGAESDDSAADLAHAAAKGAGALLRGAHAEHVRTVLHHVFLLDEALELLRALITRRAHLEVARAVFETLLFAFEQALVVELGHAGLKARVEDPIVDLVGHLFLLC